MRDVARKFTLVK